MSGFENQVTGSMGTKIYACPTLPTANTLTAWEALDNSSAFKRVRGVTDGGAFGGTYELGSEAQLEDGVMMKWKGVQNAGSASLAVLVLGGDEGQAVLKAAAKSYTPISFKYEFTNGNIVYFAALVMGWDTQVGGANDAVKAAPTLELVDLAVELEA
ncbi:MAG: hypothetical protein LBH93_00400 [Chitinispirillales bacterium]|nr:hypothetical protein [Chitinispirillales bacterium]